MMHRKPSMIVLLLLMSGFVASCASSPAVPVVSRCPQFPQAPPALLDPPKASNALTRLEAELQALLQTASPIQRD